MSVKVDGSQATIHWLSNNSHFNQQLTKDQGVLYITRDGKLGQLTAESYAGSTPQQAFESSYSGGKRQMLSDWIADDFIVFDKSSTTDADPDDGVRSLIVSLFKKKQISFSANFGTIQKENTNSESLISYDRTTHLDVLIRIAKQYFSLNEFFDTKTSMSWRFKQEEDIQEIIQRIILFGLCLYAAYTSRGKTKISIGVAVKLLQKGGIVLVTTPISDTKKSFEENIQNYHFGNDRNLKVTYMDSVAFSKCTVEELVARKQNGELIFIVLTVQDLRYGETENAQVDSSVKKLRNKYHALSGKVDLWIRDERHSQYSGEVTSQRLADMVATYELDLTATPYNVLDKYDWEQIVSRTLLWGLKHQKDTKLPTIRIDAISTPISSISPKLASVYSEEEGFDPRKLFVRSNNNFVLEAELLAIRDSMYHNTLSKRKNPLSIINDTELSSVAKNCGMWVLPEGQDGDGAADYIPDVATLLNSNSSVYFTDSYTIEKECPKNSTIGDYIESLIEKHVRVVILTCGKFLTGTDIPALGHIVLLSKMNNIANFEQLMGRMIREYPSKNDVKMYCFAPAMEIGLVMGKMAKMNVTISGGSEYDLLDCVPLTEYVNNVATKISPDHILAEVQEHLKQISKDRLPSASLETALSNSVDLSIWNNIDTKKFKKTAPKTTVTHNNGSKVKTKVSIDPNTNKPRTKDEISKLEQIAGVIQAVMLEAKWVAYSIDNYNYLDVLRNNALQSMFPDEIEMVIETIESCSTIKEMVIKNFNDKKIAYAGLDPKDVYDDIFMNNQFKQKIGLVYVNFELANEIVDKIPNKYNGENSTILVINALSGTFPILLREKFPNARIICAEYFDYFTDHLTRLGFEVAKITEKKGELSLDKKYDGIKADVVIGNPPYQTKNDEEHKKTTPIWHVFVKKSFESVKQDGYVALCHPSGWRNLGGKFEKTKNIITSNDLVYLETHNIEDGKKVFQAGTRYDCYVAKKAPYQGKTVLKDDDGIITQIDVRVLPFIPSSNVKEIAKLIAGPSDQKVNFIYSRSEYGTDYTNMADVKKGSYTHPCIQNVNINDEASCVWYSDVRKGHFGIPKVIFGRFGSGIVVDANGDFGMCQDTCAIADKPENLEKIKQAMQSSEFLELMRSADVGGLGTIFNRRVIAEFRSDFWKDFI